MDNMARTRSIRCTENTNIIKILNKFDDANRGTHQNPCTFKGLIINTLNPGSNGQGVFSIYDNNIGVDLYGADNITVITFHYQGKFEWVSVLPNGWITCGTSSSIFCFGQQSGDISGIMDYNGKIDILSASMFNKYNERYDVNIVKEEGSYFDTSNIIPEKEGSLYEDYPSGDATITKNRYKSVSLVTNNLNARQGQFCYSDGSGYIGKYHMHLNGTIMSGESHTASSEILYTKDRDGNIIYHNKEMEDIYKNN